MKSEKIIKIWRLCYLYLFDDNGQEVRTKYEYFGDKKATYECQKIFWRFYKITDIEYL